MDIEYGRRKTLGFSCTVFFRTPNIRYSYLISVYVSLRALGIHNPWQLFRWSSLVSIQELPYSYDCLIRLNPAITSNYQSIASRFLLLPICSMECIPCKGIWFRICYTPINTSLGSNNAGWNCHHIGCVITILYRRLEVIYSKDC